MNGSMHFLKYGPSELTELENWITVNRSIVLSAVVMDFP